MRELTCGMTERRFKHSLGRPEQRIETCSVKGRRGKSKSYLSWENRVSEGRMREACCRGGSCVKVLEFRCHRHDVSQENDTDAPQMKHL